MNCKFRTLILIFLQATVFMGGTTFLKADTTNASLCPEKMGRLPIKAEMIWAHTRDSNYLALPSLNSGKKRVFEALSITLKVKLAGLRPILEKQFPDLPTDSGDSRNNIIIEDMVLLSDGRKKQNSLQNSPVSQPKRSPYNIGNQVFVFSLALPGELFGPFEG